MSDQQEALQRGLGLLQAGAAADAERVFRAVVAEWPGQSDAWANLGLALRMGGRMVEAATALKRSVELDAGNADKWAVLGGVLSEMQSYEEAVRALERVVRLRPGDVAAYGGWSAALEHLERFDEALAVSRRAVIAGGGGAAAYEHLGSALRGLGRIEEAVSVLEEGVRLRPESATLHSGLVYSMLFHPGYDGAAIRAAHEQWARRHAAGVPVWSRHENDRDSERRLRIGYVSPNLCNHVIGLNLLPLLERHDRERFHITCYSDGLVADETSRRYEALSDVWRGTAGMTDEQLAEAIRQDGIDIVVDLTLHMARNRLLALARKPAPVQVTFGGYPGTTGLSAMGWRLSDPHLDPVGGDEPYTERTHRLARTWWCYNGLAMELEVGPLPALKNGYVTFGCLNNCCKVNGGVLALWARVLGAVAGSRLLMMAPAGEARVRVLGALGEQGVAAERVAFVGRQGLRKYFETFREIDIGLDTVPYNGHTTSMDALWMGVPVVTLVGKTVVGRAGLSQLRSLGLPELVAREAGEYVRIASGLAGDLAELRNTRGTLRLRMKHSPLLDDAGFARDVEEAYRAMWRTWCGYGPPAAKLP